ncbi:hypothetical protein Tco_0298698 [Tanacetum coccineum]
MDYMDTKEAMNEGRQSKETEELNVTHDTKVLEKGGSNKEPVNDAGNIGVSTAVSTVNISTASRPEVSTATPMTPPSTKSVFKDEDIFLADAMVMLSDKVLGFRSFYNLLLLVVVSTASEDLVLLIKIVENRLRSDDENPPPPPPQTPQTQQAPHTLSTIKLPILKKGEYDIWAMKMEHYLSHTDYPIWEVIQKGNGHPGRERKASTTLLMALPEDHLVKFHKMTNTKEIWDAIKSRFGGNDESKKMQKYILKQQFKGFSVSNSEGLHKGYDRFQSLLSQLEIHGAGVSTEDANHKFLRSLPTSWSQVSLVMRTKPGVESLSVDDLYNNLRVFESDVKGSTGSSLSAHNVAFVSFESTNSTNYISTAYGVSISSGHNSQWENSSSYSFFANLSSGSQLDHEDLEQLDEFDLEEMDLKWQVALISMRMKKFYKNTGRRLQFEAKEPVGFNKTKEEPKALVTLDGEGIDWIGHAEDEQENFALMAYNNSGSETEVKSCLKESVESYAKLKKLYDEQREQLGDAKSTDVENSPMNDRFEKVEGMHAVPPLMKDLLSRDLIEIVETPESMPEPVIVEPKVVSQPKVWYDAPIIEEYESDSDDEYVIKPLKEQDKPSFAFDKTDDPQRALKNKGIVDNGCSRHMNGNKAYLMCDKRNTVLFTDTECLVLSPDFKLPDENQPVRSENQANKTVGSNEDNHSEVKSSEAKNESEKPNKDNNLKTNEEPVDQEDQAFLEELERLKRQEKEANYAAETLRKEFAQDAEDLLL